MREYSSGIQPEPWTFWIDASSNPRTGCGSYVVQVMKPERMETVRTRQVAFLKVEENGQVILKPRDGMEDHFLLSWFYKEHFKATGDLEADLNLLVLGGLK